MTRRNFFKLMAVGAVTLLAFPGKLFASKSKAITGVKKGSLVAIIGEAGTYKSAWLMYQAMQYASMGKTVLYHDVDGAFSYDYAKKIQEVNNLSVPEGKLVVVRTSEINWEILPKFNVIVFDSITLLQPSFSATDTHVGWLSRTLHKLLKVAKKNGQIVLVSAQAYRSGLGEHPVIAVSQGATHASEAIFRATKNGELETIKSRAGKFLKYQMDKSFFVTQKG